MTTWRTNQNFHWVNFESLPQEHRPRLTKCKDSENDCHLPAMIKCAYTGAHESGTILCSGKLQNTKVHRSKDLSMLHSHKQEVFCWNTRQHESKMKDTPPSVLKQEKVCSSVYKPHITSPTVQAPQSRSPLISTRHGHRFDDSSQLFVIVSRYLKHKNSYRIAWNFQGRKRSQISEFCGYPWKFSPQNLGVWLPLAQQKWAICKSFLLEIIFFINPRKFSPSKVFRYTVHCMGVYQTAVLSNETFLNYSIDTGILEWKLIRTWMAGTYHKLSSTTYSLAI